MVLAPSGIAATEAIGATVDATHRALLDAEARAEVLQRWIVRAVTAASAAAVFEG